MYRLRFSKISDFFFCVITIKIYSRDNAKYRNSEIEKAISKIQEQLQQEDFPWDQDNELKNVQIKMEELTEEITKLNDEMPELKNKLRNAKACGKGMK